MKIFLFALLFFSAAAEGGQSLSGHWFYFKKIYQGNEMPEPPEATLRLHYEFHEDGSSRLYWWHEGEQDRCEREGRYYLEDGHIVERATRVHPDNHPFCSRDPDMQEGRITRTRFDLVDGNLHLYLPLADEFLVYVWKRVGKLAD